MGITKQYINGLNMELENRSKERSNALSMVQDIVNNLYTDLRKKLDAFHDECINTDMSDSRYKDICGYLEMLRQRWVEKKRFYMLMTTDETHFVVTKTCLGEGKPMYYEEAKGQMDDMKYAYEALGIQPPRMLIEAVNEAIYFQYFNELKKA